MRPTIALRLLPLTVFALIISGCGSAAKTAAAPPGAVPPTSAAASLSASAAPSASPPPPAKPDAAVVKTAVIPRSWAAQWTVIVNKAMKARPITACGVTSVVPKGDEPPAGWQIEWSDQGEGFGQTVMGRTKDGSTLIVKTMEAMEKSCPTYTVNGAKTSRLTPKTTFPTLAPWVSYLSCGKTTRSGRATKYHCVVWFGKEHLIASVHAFSTESLARAEWHLGPILNTALLQMTSADSA